MSTKNDIDIVIIWVDGGDAAWQKEKVKYSPDANTDSGQNRYRDWGTLPYLFRSIDKYAPWVRKVHFVTNGQKPDWLDLRCPKLNFVEHADFMPKKYLPTFSSHPIELNIHRIKGLSEKFIYFNDDMFITRPLNQNDFFKRGLPCDQSVFCRITSSDYKEVFWHVLLNNIGVINRNFSRNSFIKQNYKKLFSPKNGILAPILSATYLPLNHIPGFMINHVPQPFLKSTFEAVWEAESELLDSISMQKFRSTSDVNQYLMKEWQFMTGAYSPKNVFAKTRNFSIFPKQLDDLRAAIVSRKYQTICINDTEVDDFDRSRREVVEIFEHALPDSSQFEKKEEK